MPTVDTLLRFIRSHGVHAWGNDDGSITIEHVVKNTVTGAVFYELDTVAPSWMAVRASLGY